MCLGDLREVKKKKKSTGKPFKMFVCPVSFKERRGKAEECVEALTEKSTDVFAWDARDGERKSRN